MATTAKKSLLDIVTEVLIAVKGDPVNSISDTEQAGDIAILVQSVFFDMVSRRQIPEHNEMSQLDGLADTDRPTYLQIPDRVKLIKRLDYDVSTVSGTTDFRTLTWLEPTDFLDMTMLKNTSDTTTQTMASINSDAEFIIHNDRMPHYWTTFDDAYVVCDSFDSDEENTLQTSNTRAYVSKIPTFELTDTFVPELDDPQFRQLINESRSLASAVESRTLNPKLEQAARKQRMLTQNDRHRDGNRHKVPSYGRT